MNLFCVMSQIRNSNSSVCQMFMSAMVIPDYVRTNKFMKKVFFGFLQISLESLESWGVRVGSWAVLKSKLCETRQSV